MKGVILMVSKKTLLIILSFFIYLIIAMLIHSKIAFHMDFYLKIYPYIFIIGAIYIPAGILLGYLTCQERFQITGEWKFNTRYFLYMMIPSLFLFFYHYINYLPYGKLPSFFAVPYLKTKLFPVYGLLVGFSLITSFYKVDEAPSETPVN